MCYLPHYSKSHGGILISCRFLKFLYEFNLKNVVKFWKYFLWYFFSLKTYRVECLISWFWEGKELFETFGWKSLGSSSLLFRQLEAKHMCVLTRFFKDLTSKIQIIKRIDGFQLWFSQLRGLYTSRNLGWLIKETIYYCQFSFLKNFQRIPKIFQETLPERILEGILEKIHEKFLKKFLEEFPKELPKEFPKGFPSKFPK